jgi:hypothetical protein
MGQLDSACTAPPPVAPLRQQLAAQLHGVAVQVAFVKSKGLKSGNHLIGSRLETRPFQAQGQLDSTRTDPPWRGP